MNAARRTTDRPGHHSGRQSSCAPLTKAGATLGQDMGFRQRRAVAAVEPARCTKWKLCDSRSCFQSTIPGIAPVPIPRLQQESSAPRSESRPPRAGGGHAQSAPGYGRRTTSSYPASKRVSHAKSRPSTRYQSENSPGGSPGKAAKASCKSFGSHSALLPRRGENLHTTSWTNIKSNG